MAPVGKPGRRTRPPPWRGTSRSASGRDLRQGVGAIETAEVDVGASVAIDIAEGHTGAVEQDLVGEGAFLAEAVGEADAGDLGGQVGETGGTGGRGGRGARRWWGWDVQSRAITVGQTIATKRIGVRRVAGRRERMGNVQTVGTAGDVEARVKAAGGCEGGHGGNCVTC